MADDDDEETQRSQTWKRLTDAKEKIKRLLRDPELRKVLRYPNATVSGDHYVLPVAVNHRQKVPGVVHRGLPDSS